MHYEDENRTMLLFFALLKRLCSRSDHFSGEFNIIESLVEFVWVPWEAGNLLTLRCTGIATSPAAFVADVTVLVIH